MDDEDAQAIRLRRAKLVSAALACIVGCGDEASDRSQPTVCLSFSLVCPKGSEPRAGIRDLLTARPDPDHDCVPIGSPSSKSAATGAVPATATATTSAQAIESAKPEPSGSSSK